MADKSFTKHLMYSMHGTIYYNPYMCVCVSVFFFKKNINMVMNLILANILSIKSDTRDFLSACDLLLMCGL